MVNPNYTIYAPIHTALILYPPLSIPEGTKTFLTNFGPHKVYTLASVDSSGNFLESIEYHSQEHVSTNDKLGIGYSPDKIIKSKSILYVYDTKQIPDNLVLYYSRYVLGEDRDTFYDCINITSKDSFVSKSLSIHLDEDDDFEPFIDFLHKIYMGGYPDLIGYEFLTQTYLKSLNLP